MGPTPRELGGAMAGAGAHASQVCLWLLLPPPLSAQSKDLPLSRPAPWAPAPATRTRAACASCRCTAFPVPPGSACSSAPFARVPITGPVLPLQPRFLARPGQPGALAEGPTSAGSLATPRRPHLWAWLLQSRPSPDRSTAWVKPALFRQSHRGTSSDRGGVAGQSGIWRPVPERQGGV